MQTDDRRPDTALSDEAIEWIVRLNSGHASEADRQAFGQWRALSADHALAAQEAEAVWHGIGAAGSEARKAADGARLQRVTRRAVVAALVAGGTGLAVERSGLIPPRLWADHVTGTGEQRSVALPDGSSVMLNAASALSVDYTDGRRRLVLYEGQAAFTVARDPDRPFVVEADGGQTRALGTVFDVDIRSSEVVVTVIEGVVAVASDAAPQDGVTVRADQRASYRPHGAVSPVEIADGAAASAWRRGKLIFNRRPLGDVVAEIERHRPGLIVIANPALRKLDVTGVFELGDPDAILNTMEQTLPVRVTRLPLVTILR